MFEQSESKRKQGRITALALLFGLLLGFSGSGPVQFDSSTARLAKGDVLRTASLRIGGRSAEDNPDADTAPALLFPVPRIVTAVLSVQPLASPVPAVAYTASIGHHSHYRARAPPAA